MSNKENFKRALQDPKYWRPNISEIAKDLELSVPYAHQLYNALDNDLVVVICPGSVNAVVRQELKAILGEVTKND